MDPIILYSGLDNQVASRVRGNGQEGCMPPIAYVWYAFDVGVVSA